MNNTALAHANAGPMGDGVSCSNNITKPRRRSSSHVDLKQQWGPELGAVYVTVTQSATDAADAVREALLAIAAGAAT